MQCWGFSEVLHQQGARDSRREHPRRECCEAGLNQTALPGGSLFSSSVPLGARAQPPPSALWRPGRSARGLPGL